MTIRPPMTLPTLLDWTLTTLAARAIGVPARLARTRQERRP